MKLLELFEAVKDEKLPLPVARSLPISFKRKKALWRETLSRYSKYNREVVCTVIAPASRML